VSTTEQTVSPDEIELRYWLANEDWYPSRYTREWLERTPPDMASETLARIAEDAYPESHLPWVVFFAALAVAGFFPSNAIAGRRPDARKAGLRAALMLADRNNARALPALVRVFETSGVWQGKYQEKIEAALLRLTDKSASPKMQQYAPDILALAERLRAFGGRREISPRNTRLLLALLPHLPPDAPLLKSIADAQARPPNRRKVSELAQALLKAAEEKD